MLPRLFSLLLLLLTRDGLLHRFDGAQDDSSPAPGARAFALVGGKVAIVAGKQLSLAGKALRGDFSDVRALVGSGATLWALAGDRALAIDLKSGKRVVLLERPRLHRLAADGDALFAETDGTIERVGCDAQKQAGL